MSTLRPCVLLLNFSVLAACGAPDSTVHPGDAGTAASDASVVIDAAVTCGTIDLPAEVRTTVGGRVLFDLRDASGDVEVRAPDGWRTAFDETSRQLVVRTAYRSESDSIDITFQCGADVATRSVRIEVRAPTWRSLAAVGGADGPPPLLTPGLWIDPTESSRIHVLGGLDAGFRYRAELWAFNPERTRWTALADLDGLLQISGGTPVHVAPAHAVVVFDQNAGSSRAADQAVSLVDYGGEQPELRVLTATTPTNGWYGGAFFYVPSLGRYAALCGATDTTAHCDLHLYDPTADVWETPIVAAEDGRPIGRFGFAYAWDPVAARLVLFSGAQEIVGGGYVADDETWALELNEAAWRWRRIDAGAAPSPRVYGCSVYDEAGHRLLTFGGGVGATPVADALYALDLDRGVERWSQLDTTDGPDSRSLCGAAYDATDRQLVIGFGTDAFGAFGDLWALEL